MNILRRFCAPALPIFLLVVALAPAPASAQGPFEDAAAASSPPSEPAPSKEGKDSSGNENGDHPSPTPRPTEGRQGAAMFRVVSSPQQVTVRLRSPDPGATFSVLSGTSMGTVSTFGTSVTSTGRSSFSTSTGVISSGRFDRVCTAPCAVAIDPGVHRWLLELPDGRSGATGPTSISKDTTLEARYVSATGARTTVAVFGAVTMVMGVVLNAVALDRGHSLDSGVMWLGFGSEFISLPLFKVATDIDDSVEVKEIPTRTIPRSVRRPAYEPLPIESSK